MTATEAREISDGKSGVIGHLDSIAKSIKEASDLGLYYTTVYCSSLDRATRTRVMYLLQSRFGYTISKEDSISFTVEWTIT